jgi:hypothetical protein
VITLTDTMPDPLHDSSAAQAIPLPDAPSTAPTTAKGWTTIKGKATWQKRKHIKEEKTTPVMQNSKTPIMKNGRRGKNTY